MLLITDKPYFIFTIKEYNSQTKDIKNKWIHNIIITLNKPRVSQRKIISFLNIAKIT